MPRVVVHVMPKPELLDPQGKAISRALARNGFAVADARQGKRFELELEGPITEATRADIERIASEVLSNAVIENVVSIEVLD
ncbi:MAG TPA: phosphoribosylformylglycinamidine synthase subunit PurS [Microbacteriaceae bacterium]|nr:phosphoribosylformylglycinamidine synthase subunit PurS [Microbacteriaceae bacterium]